MIQNITTYYIPQNLNIPTGKIYELYLNKVTNLELSSILKENNITLNTIIKPNQEIVTNSQLSSNTTSIKQEYYEEILKMAEISTELYNQSQALIKKLKIGSEKK